MSFSNKERPLCGLDLALQWSFELLSPVEQFVLSQATVFAGGFDLAAAAAVFDLTPWAHSDALLDVLDQLVALGCEHQFNLGRLLGERCNLLLAVERAIERGDAATAYGAARAALVVLQAYGPLTVAQTLLCDVLALSGLSQEQRQELLRIQGSLLAMSA